MKINIYFILLIILMSLSGCYGPTDPSEIEPSYASPAKYEGLGCSQLSLELESAIRTENFLVMEQNNRIASSRYFSSSRYFAGLPIFRDGVEAQDLANVRGDKVAITKIMKNKNCEF